MSFTIESPGLLTTVQDLGRTGYKRLGVPSGGAVDATALRIANIVVGNEEGAAGLEMTLQGATLRFDVDALIALGGADFGAVIDGDRLPMWRPIIVSRGSTLRFGAAASGCRAYMAVAGGIDVPLVLGSRGTELRAGFGGFEGRALRTGDRLRVGDPSDVGQKLAQMLNSSREDHRPFVATTWSPSLEVIPSYAHDMTERNPQGAGQLSREVIPLYARDATVRVMKGPEWDRFSEQAQTAFFSERYTETPQSDRMGARLIGSEGSGLPLHAPFEMITEAVTPGTIQVPSGHGPIVLLADCGTTGGYPRIAQVALVDLPLMAQLRPGDTVQFQEIPLAAAQELTAIYAWELSILRKSVARKAMEGVR